MLIPVYLQPRVKNKQNISFMPHSVVNEVNECFLKGWVVSKIYDPLYKQQCTKCKFVHCNTKCVCIHILYVLVHTYMYIIRVQLSYLHFTKSLAYSLIANFFKSHFVKSKLIFTLTYPTYPRMSSSAMTTQPFVVYWQEARLAKVYNKIYCCSLY